MSDIKHDLKWVQGVISDPAQLDNILSVGRAQRILGRIAELEAELGRDRLDLMDEYSVLDVKYDTLKERLDRVRRLAQYDTTVRVGNNRHGDIVKAKVVLTDELQSALGDEDDA